MYAKIIIPTLEQNHKKENKMHTNESLQLACPSPELPLPCSNTALLKLYFLGTPKFHWASLIALCQATIVSIP